jgi:hypothetical protein
VTVLEQLLSLADPETIAMARNIIGREQLALMIAKAALEGTTAKVAPQQAANVLEMPQSTVSGRIDRIKIKSARTE